MGAISLGKIDVGKYVHARGRGRVEERRKNVFVLWRKGSGCVSSVKLSQRWQTKENHPL
jgi:hypothetical protein